MNLIKIDSNKHHK